MLNAPFFYEPTLEENTSTLMLSEESHKHAIQVLRMKSGDALHITNGRGCKAIATIIASDKKNTTTAITHKTWVQEKEKQIILAVSLLKNPSRFEWMLEKATEMGIDGIIPLLCKRTEKQHFRTDRMQKILIAAMLQSQQVFLPHLSEPLPLNKLTANNNTQLLIAHCATGEKQNILHYIPSHAKTIMLIGPEGDFTEEEITHILSMQAIAITLGNTRLRTETAAIKAAAFLTHI